jgi:hypothetical protein
MYSQSLHVFTLRIQLTCINMMMILFYPTPLFHGFIPCVMNWAASLLCLIGLTLRDLALYVLSSLAYRQAHRVLLAVSHIVVNYINTHITRSAVLVLFSIVLLNSLLSLYCHSGVLLIYTLVTSFFLLSVVLAVS